MVLAATCAASAATDAVAAAATACVAASCAVWVGSDIHEPYRKNYSGFYYQFTTSQQFHSILNKKMYCDLVLYAMVIPFTFGVKKC
jgi:hypothetical protein